MTKRGLLLAAALLPVALIAHVETGRTSRGGFAHTVLRDVLRRHPEIKMMELAVATTDGCVTIAATDAGDIGHKCGKQERQAMWTREPHVEHPDEDDPAFVITEALHDAAGRVVGVVTTDIVVREPGANRDAALARARGVRRTLEARIPSIARLKNGTLAVAEAP